MSKILTYSVCFFVTVTSILLFFTGLGSGNSQTAASDMSYLYLSLGYLAVGILINGKIKNKQKAFSLALVFPIILIVLQTAYTHWYLFPRIEKYGVSTTGFVIDTNERPFGDGGVALSSDYEYTVDNKTYHKYTFDKDLSVGDTILIKYLKSNPDLHKYYLFKERLQKN